MPEDAYLRHDDRRRAVAVKLWLLGSSAKVGAEVCAPAGAQHAIRREDLRQAEIGELEHLALDRIIPPGDGVGQDVLRLDVAVDHLRL